jgi:hypothetical protein
LCSLYLGRVNTTDTGGGIMAKGYSDIILINNTIVYNKSLRKDGSRRNGGALSTQGGFATFSGRNNIIYFNESEDNSQYTAIYGGGETNFTHTCISQEMSGKGNIFDDPLFINPEKDDFHLKKNSPCINAGKKQNGKSMNMGAL